MASSDASGAPRSPYVGPRPFERSAEDRARFFGRDEEVAEIVSLIVSHPLVLVYAQSGAGKTSMFNTQVSEELERKRFVVLPLARVRGAVGGGLTADAIKNLYVFSALQGIDADADRQELAGLTLAEYLARTSGTEPQPRALVFDQFEELFTSELVYELYGDDWQTQQEAFFLQVSQALAGDPMLRVVFVMRKEYLAELERFTTLLPERVQTRFHLEPLDGEEALEAVKGPLRGTSCTFAEGVAEKLVDRLLAMRVGPERDVRGRHVEPVQLQLVCRSLWQDLPPGTTTITEAHVQAFGDVDTVLAQFYDRAVRAAASAAHSREGRLRGKLEDDFITSIGTRGTVYRTRGWERLSAALDELERRHVIHAEWRAGTRWYELTHDRLIDPIRRSNEAFRSRLRKRQAGALTVLAALGGIGVALAFVFSAGGRETAVATTTVANAPAQVLAQQAAANAFAPIVVAAPIEGGSRIASVTTSGTVQTMSIDGSRRETFRIRDGVRAAAFSSNGRLALFGFGDGQVDEWDMRARRKLRPISVRGGPTTAIAFAPDGSRAALASGDEVGILDPQTGEFVLQRSYRSNVTAIAFHPTGRTIAAGLASGLVVLTPLRGRQRSLVGGPNPIDAVAFSRDGGLVIAGSHRAALRIWSAADGKLVVAFPFSSGSVTAVGLSPDGQQLVAATGNFAVSVLHWRPFEGYDLTNHDDIKQFQRAHHLRVDGIVGPQTLATAQRIGAVTTLVGHTAKITSAWFTPDGDRVVTASADGTTRVWGFFGAAATVRERIVQAALAATRTRIRYSQVRPMSAIVQRVRLPNLPSVGDSGAFVTWCYFQAGAPDPNGLGYNGQGYTGTLLAHMRHVPQAAALPGDLVVWGPAPGHHVALVVAAGPDPLLASHGSSQGPQLIRFSKEDARQPRPATWLTEDLGP